jgi:rRNA maturation RNase YbeY
MNQKHLKHDFYTDIITFDYSDKEVISGDLFISIDRVRGNASSLKLLFFSELLRVIAHGHLHLIGYNDKSKPDQIQMTLQEERWIAAFEKFIP